MQPNCEKKWLPFLVSLGHEIDYRRIKVSWASAFLTGPAPLLIPLPAQNLGNPGLKLLTPTHLCSEKSCEW